MLVRKLLMTALVLGLCCPAVMGAQTLNSASGYVQLPDADVQSRGTVDLSAAYVRSEGTNELSELFPELEPPMPCDGNGWNVRALGGLWDRFEIGGGYLQIDKELGDAKAWSVAAKYKVYENCAKDAAIAVGASYRDWDSNMAVIVSDGYYEDTLDVELPQVFSAYLAWDKRWVEADESNWGVKTTIGVMYDRYTSSQQKTAFPFLVVPPGYPVSRTGVVAADSFVSPFFGVKLDKGGWNLMAEFKPRLRKDRFFYAKDIWSVAVGKDFGSSLSAKAGVTNFNLPYTDSDPGFFFDLSYRFGK